MAPSDYQQAARIYFCRFYGCPIQGKGFTAQEIVRHANLEHADKGPEYRRDEFHKLFANLRSNSTLSRKPSPSHDSVPKEGRVGLRCFACLILTDIA